MYVLHTIQYMHRYDYIQTPVNPNKNSWSETLPIVPTCLPKVSQNILKLK